MSSKEAVEITRDTSSRLIVSGLVNGVRTIKLMRKGIPMELVFKLNQDTGFHHPILNEDVKVLLM